MCQNHLLPPYHHINPFILSAALILRAAFTLTTTFIHGAALFILSATLILSTHPLSESHYVHPNTNPRARAAPSLRALLHRMAHAPSARPRPQPPSTPSPSQPPPWTCPASARNAKQGSAPTTTAACLKTAPIPPTPSPTTVSRSCTWTLDRARARGEKWIEVSLNDQTLYAWRGDRLVNRFIISSGVDDNPTVTGLFRVWARTAAQTMDGGDRASGTYYSLPNVQWVQYFHHGYAFHGAYWHNNFGTPMSHGCVNLTVEDAEWLFNWAFPAWNGSGAWLRTNENDATLVWVHE